MKFRVSMYFFFQANLGNMDKKSEQWKMIGGNMALVQVWSYLIVKMEF